MPLLSTKCLQENYTQKADYEIFTAKTHCGNRASVQKQSNKCASLRKNEKVLSKKQPKRVLSQNILEVCQAFFNI